MKTTPSSSPAPKSDSRAHAHGQAREQLLLAAAELFSQHGQDGVSIREIAAKAGVRHGGVNYHFHSKRELYLEVINRFGPRGNHVAEGGNPALHAAFEVRGAEQARICLGQLIEDHLSAITEYSHAIFGGLLAHEIKRPEGPDEQIFQNVILLRHRAIEHLLKQIEPKLTDSRSLRLHAMGITSQCVIFRLAGPVPYRLLGSDPKQGLPHDEMKAIAQHILNSALRGLSGNLSEESSS